MGCVRARMPSSVQEEVVVVVVVVVLVGRHNESVIDRSGTWEPDPNSPDPFRGISYVITLPSGGRFSKLISSGFFIN